MLGAHVEVATVRGSLLFSVLRAPTVPVRSTLLMYQGALGDPPAEAALAAQPHHAAAGDAELVLAIRSGGRAAEEQLYRRHAGAVLGLATRLLHSREEAMDVMQDAFVTAFEELGALREPAAFRSWLLRLTASLVHRRFRKRKLLRILGLGGERAEVSLDDLADPALSPEAHAELRLVDQKLRTLPEAERAAWLLRQVEGFALEEVAEACGCSLATAKRRIASADALVRRHVGDGGSR